MFHYEVSDNLKNLHNFHEITKTVMNRILEYKRRLIRTLFTTLGARLLMKKKSTT